jgi:hypothetical protein
MHRNHAFIAAVAVLLASASETADDRSAVVPWEPLAQVTVTKQIDRDVTEFSKQIVALDKREVKLNGFMLLAGEVRRPTDHRFFRNSRADARRFGRAPFTA